MRFGADIGLWNAVCCDVFGAGQAVSGVAQAAGSVAAAAAQAGAIKDAAKLSADATNRATDLLQQRYQTTRADLAPFAGVGQSAASRLASIYGLPTPAPAAPVATAGNPLTGPAPAAVAAPAVGPAPAAAAAGAGQLASLGFTPQGSLPPGFSVQQVGGGEGEGPARKVLTDSTGAIVTDLPNVPLSDDPASQTIQNNAAIAFLRQNGATVPGAVPAATAADASGLSGAPQATAAPLVMTPGGLASTAGALPGAGSAVTPYALPDGGVFSFNPTQDQIANTPGYQFVLAQGLKATQSNAAARGLGLSGAAMKEAGQYATGLADSRYLDYYNQMKDAWTTNFNAANTANDQYYKYNIAPLFNLLTGGENAAANSGYQGTLSGNAAANLLQSGGTNAAALGLAGGNAGASAIKGIAQGINTINSGIDYNKLLGGGGSSGPNYGAAGLQNYDPYDPNSAINNYIS